MERFFADLTEDVIGTGSFASVDELVRDIEAYLAQRNANPRPYKWKAEGGAILDELSAPARLSKTRKPHERLFGSQDTSIGRDLPSFG